MCPSGGGDRELQSPLSGGDGPEQRGGCPGSVQRGPLEVVWTPGRRDRGLLPLGLCDAPSDGMSVALRRLERSSNVAEVQVQGCLSVAASLGINVTRKHQLVKQGRLFSTAEEQRAHLEQ